METFKLIGIDPGKNVGITILTLGVAEYTSFEAFKLSPPKHDIVIVDVETHYVSLDNLIDPKADDAQLERVKALKTIITKLMEYCTPDFLAIEEAFMNVRYPKAVMQLSQYFSIILETAWRVNPYIRFFRYPPKLVKSSIGAGGAADKNGMLVTVKRIIDYSSRLRLDSLTEHEIDSLAIAYIALEEIRRYPFLLYV